MDLILTCKYSLIKYSLIKYSLNKQCVYGRAVRRQQTVNLPWRNPIVGSNPTGHANKYN